jgi:thiopurine S-methyltransferase
MVTLLWSRVNYGIYEGGAVTEDWIERWHTGRTGWHETEGSAALRKHWLGNDKRVLVPLCGKSRDLLWLEEQGNEVVGVEVAEIAVRSFFEENGLAFDRKDGALPVYSARDRRLSIVCGDYYALQDDEFDAHFDRGALIAIAPSARERYAEHTSKLLSADASQLVITLEYDQDLAGGPPFSVMPEAVTSLWPGLECVERREDIGNAPPKFLQAGLESIHEVVWRKG